MITIAQVICLGKEILNVLCGLLHLIVRQDSLTVFYSQANNYAGAIVSVFNISYFNTADHRSLSKETSNVCLVSGTFQFSLRTKGLELL